MLEQENRKPLQQWHEQFAQELAALCRKHKVQRIDATFYGIIFHGDDWRPFQGNRVTVSWGQGRHGAESQINLRAEAHGNINEKPS